MIGKLLLCLLSLNPLCIFVAKLHIKECGFSVYKLKYSWLFL